MIRTPLPALLLASLLTLVGCSGDDDPPPITAQAAADTATATWNTATPIDVLANDSVSSGDKRLTAVARQPANGTAMVADGRISYRPRDGFYGSDTLRYTMASADGTASAEAEVAITVEAELLLSGQAIDAPLPQAAVQISGAASATAVADALGQWQARLRLSDPNGVLRIDARGAGTQQHVRLTSLAATIALVSAAAANGAVVADKAPALTVSHFSTAQAALIARTPAGLPTTATALAAAQAAVDPAAMLNLATLVHMAADEGLALPEGKTDTWALAADATASAALLAAQSTGDGLAFQQAQQRALDAGPPAAALPTSGSLVLRTIGFSSVGVTAFDLASDGTARVAGGLGSRTARWTQSGDGMVVTLDEPLSQANFSADIDPGTGFQSQLRVDTLAYRLKRLPGGLVALSSAVTETVLDGSRAGQVRAVSALADPGQRHRLTQDPAVGAPLTAADFAAGRRWAGILIEGAAGFGPNADVMEITTVDTARALRSGVTFRLQLQGASFTLVGSDGSHREYLRLGDGAAGSTDFMVTDRSGPEVLVSGAVLVAPAPGLVFTPASASRTWVTVVPAEYTAGLISLRPDGSADYLGTAGSWQVLADGRLQVVRPRLGGRQTRTDWIPLSQGSTGSMWVLHRQVLESAAAPLADNAASVSWSLRHIKDTGPAT